MAELSQRSGVSIATIKFYLREGLLPPGTATGRNQADYPEEHLRRLRLIRALMDVGGLTVAAARNVLGAIDDPAIYGHDLLGVAHYSIAKQSRWDRSSPQWLAARHEVTERITKLGWRVSPHAAALDQLADAVAAMRELGQEDLLSLLDVYAPAMEKLAQKEVDAVVARGERAAMVEGVITGTVLGEAILTALRRLAQEHASAGQRPG
jgi:DNA-binding transcriptional MerR regulator